MTENGTSRSLWQVLWPVTAADFIIRSAYQMGKTPLLPIFAASLGATGALLGFITSVSTLTGMISKPLFGALSDRGGRRRWLLLATALLVLTPFLYAWLNRPEQLVLLRLFHGLGTAIYGPVTLAHVGERIKTRRAESFGWFGYARSGGYIVGPLLGGWLLFTLDAASVYRIVGVLSAAAFVPLFHLREEREETETSPRPSSGQTQLTSFRQALRLRWVAQRVWLAGAWEALSYLALYALRAFLPIFALAAGATAFDVGTYFAAQEATHILARPHGGRLGDRWGYYPCIALGLTLLALALLLLSVLQHGAIWFSTALALGLAQALIFPATLALVAGRLPATQLGTGMGFLGALRNGGKVFGPLLGGFLIQWLGFQSSLQCFALLVLACAAVSFWRSFRFRPVSLN
ncbi:MAG: MFS transporter [Anaerolineaceae bacterium]|nr:MFS transporter [Anaerolineaceae bacterium]